MDRRNALEARRAAQVANLAPLLAAALWDVAFAIEAGPLLSSEN